MAGKGDKEERRKKKKKPTPKDNAQSRNNVKCTVHKGQHWYG